MPNVKWLLPGDPMPKNPADTTEGHPFTHSTERLLEARYIHRLNGEQVEGDTLGAFWPHTGEPGELIYEILEWSFEHA